jgi:hypothetical protein
MNGSADRLIEILRGIVEEIDRGNLVVCQQNTSTLFTPNPTFSTINREAMRYIRGEIEAALKEYKQNVKGDSLPPQEKPMDKTNTGGGMALESTTLLSDLDWLIREIERGDQMAWDGDDFIRLLGALRRTHEFIAACSAEDTLRRIASIAHHGGLLGMDAFTAVKEIRKLTLPWWDRDECGRLQRQNAALEGGNVPSNGVVGDCK